MDNYETTLCPKCGKSSQNSQICDFCGAVFAKVREREYGGETLRETQPMSEYVEPSSGSGSRVVFYVLAALIVLGGAGAAGYWYLRPAPPQSIDELIAAHRNVAKRARRVVADEIEKQKRSSEHKKLYQEALALEVAIGRLAQPDNPDDNWKIRVSSLNEANGRLTELLSMSTQEFVATAARLNYADPFDEVDKKLDIAENPELAKKADNPLLRTIDLLRGSLKSAIRQ
jgi:hypothetical protein